MDFYEALDVDKDASEEEIKDAFRRKAKRHHPDKGGSEKEFNKVSEAYAILSDPYKRDQYDKTGNSDTMSEESRILLAVMSRLAGVFGSIVDNLGPMIFRTDVKSEMSRTIVETRKRFSIRKKAAEQKLRHYGRVRKRIGFKREKRNVFTDVLDEKIKGCHREAAECSFEVKVGNKMLQIIRDFNFTYDKFEQLTEEQTSAMIRSQLEEEQRRDRNP